MSENEADYAETLRVAYQRYLAGDLDSIEALLDPDVYWQGRKRGHLWWKETPS